MAAQRVILLIPVLIFLTQLCIIEVRAGNGIWSNWSKWSPCFVTCGRGVSFRYRECDNPPPSDNGKDCAGRTQENRECTAKREWAVITCDPPKIIENGHAITLFFAYGSELEYKCDKGFILNTDETIYCTEEGIWSKTDVACIEYFYEPCGTNRIEIETNMTCVTGIPNATEGTWPWMAAIHRKKYTNSFTPWCTGFLIDKKHVVSAAHYFTDKETHLYKVKLGSVDQEAGEEYTVTRIVVPRDYASGSFYDNIAILTLSREVDIPNFLPVCLPDNQIINKYLTGTGTTLAGWTGYARPYRRFLHQLSGMPVISNEECDRRIKFYLSLFPRGLTSGIFCARSEIDSGGACVGVLIMTYLLLMIFTRKQEDIEKKETEVKSDKEADVS